jgi:hypothetical protein
MVKLKASNSGLLVAALASACARPDAPAETTSVAVDEVSMIESNGFPQAHQPWSNSPIPQEQADAGLVVVELDAKPSDYNWTPIDAVIGFSNGPARAFSNLGPILRFSPQSTIDARNGDRYMAQTSYWYGVWTEYHIKFVIDLSAKSYSAFIRERYTGQPYIEIAHDYAFRTEQSGLSRVDTIAGFVDSASGALSFGNVDVKPELCQSPAPGWTAFPFPTQSNHFKVQFDTIPSAPSGTTIDGVAGISRLSPTRFSDLAAIVRFNSAGSIDARSGGTYVADQAIPYTLGHTYRFQLEVDHATKRYGATVIDLASPFDTRYIGRDLAYRSEQNTVATLGWQGAYVDGPGCCLKTCSLMVWNY